MSRQTDHEAMTDAADRLEPQMEARFLRAADRMRASVDLDALTLALARRLRNSRTPTIKSHKIIYDFLGFFLKNFPIFFS